MALTDDQFREAFKPLPVPAHFDPDDTKENKVIFALAELGRASAGQVNAHLRELQPDLIEADTMITADHILRSLFERGLVKGREENGELMYDLSKITRANDGEVDPELLAPGLD